MLLFLGTYVSLTSVVLVDLLGLEKLTNAFGLILLFQGVASIFGPLIVGNKIFLFCLFFINYLFISLTGFTYDFYGTYEIGFYIIGAVVMLSGVMLVLIDLSFLSHYFRKLMFSKVWSFTFKQHFHQVPFVPACDSTQCDVSFCSLSTLPHYRALFLSHHLYIYQRCQLNSLFLCIYICNAYTHSHTQCLQFFQQNHLWIFNTARFINFRFDFIQWSQNKKKYFY